MGSCFGGKSKKASRSTWISKTRFKHSARKNSRARSRATIEKNNTNRVTLNTTTAALEQVNTSKEVSRPVERNRSSTAPAIATATATRRAATASNAGPRVTRQSDSTSSHGLPSKEVLPPIAIESSRIRLNQPRALLVHSKHLQAGHIPGVCGLKNIGNTCFMNSAIQCLNSIPDLTQWIMKQPPPLRENNVIDVYISLVQSMWSGRNAGVDPSKLKQMVSRTAPIFTDFGQKDAQEFMNSLLNAIQDVNPNSYLVNLFQIHTESKTICSKNQHVDITDESITFLPLPLPDMNSPDGNSVALEDLIRDFCQEDELTGEYYCQPCNKCLSARQKTSIIEPLPRALVIQLKRFPFDYSSRKLDTLVRYQLEHHNLLSNNDKYTLSAVSMHSGSLSGGHYTTVARNYQNEKWYRFNDSHVGEIDEKSVVAPFEARHAYILVYLKQECGIRIYISEEVNFRSMIIPRKSKQCLNGNISGKDKVYFIFHSSDIPVSVFYQGNDFEQETLVDQLEESSNDVPCEIVDTIPEPPSCVPTDTNPVASIDFLLLFIYYLQLLNIIRRPSPLAIAHGSTITSAQSTTTDIPHDTSKNKKKKSKKTVRKTAFEPGLCGLNNIGNTCFMNSAIQCLSNIPQLTEWAQNQQIPEHSETVTQAYTSLIQSMWSGDNSSVTPRSIKKRVSKYAPIFTNFAQKDSHEFMNSLLNALHSELAVNDSSEEQSSIVTDVFCIRTKSGVTCLTCDFADSTDEITYCLPLPLGDEDEVSLDTLITEFTKEEQLDGDYYCSNCQDLRLAKQKTSICSPLPPVIVVQLKRFSFDDTYDKLDTFVDYPVDNWKVLENDDTLYDLVAVSMHVGNLKGGHYTTYARLNGSGEWYHFNDSFIRRCDDRDELVSRNAYVLIYLKHN